ncbi:MAG TPA: PilZ domain-containing protein [Chthonomonadaceae bacterium]|nr:PilZ domain-containing protein [Chthonomonadaceae bacterium]
MLPIAEDIAIRIEVLNAQEKPIACLEATLRHLDGERAAILLPLAAPASCLHWGSRVRFYVEQQAHVYEILGSVIAREVTSESACALQVRLWECRTGRQRRAVPRRAARFPVQFAPLESASAAEPQEQAWQCGQCLDISCAGMRLRVPLQPALPERFLLRFTLPAPAGGETPSPAFCLQGRLLRARPLGRQADAVEIALKFEKLTPAQGLALSALLS